MKEPSTAAETSVALLAKLEKFVGRMPGQIRKLETTPADLEIARGLDRDASDPEEGAINPEQSDTTATMTEAALERWVKGDKKHNMRVFCPSILEDGKPQEKTYGFGYASVDDIRDDPRYDPGFKRRADFVGSEAELGNKELFEFNFWADRADDHFPKDNTELRHDTSASWVAKHLFSLFKQRALKEGNPNSLAFFMSVEQSDFEIDGRI